MPRSQRHLSTDVRSTAIADTGLSVERVGREETVDDGPGRDFGTRPEWRNEREGAERTDTSSSYIFDLMQTQSSLSGNDPMPGAAAA